MEYLTLKLASVVEAIVPMTDSGLGMFVVSEYHIHNKL